MAPRKIQAMSAEKAIWHMAYEAGVSLETASRMVGRSVSWLGGVVNGATRARAECADKPRGPRVDTLAAVAEAMGYHLALIGHGEVIEVVPGSPEAWKREGEAGGHDRKQCLAR